MTPLQPARTLVAVPGLGLSERSMAPTLDRLGPGWRTSVLHLPGYGEPGSPGAPQTPAALAVRLLDQLARPAVLLGHSASCQVVVEAARRAPGRVPGLVLVGPTGDPRAAARAVLFVRWLRSAVHERPWTVPTLLSDYTGTGPVTMVRALAAVRRHSIADALAHVQVPTLVIRGRYDRIAPADWTAHLAAVAPTGKAVSLPAGAHMVPLTHPAALAARIHASHA